MVKSGSYQYYTQLNMDKTILLASFIFPERKEWFLSYLQNKFGIPSDKVFVYENLDDQAKLIMTFKLLLEDGKHINLKDLFPNAIIIHKKGDALYTINALNKLIENENPDGLGNIDYKSVKVDWGLYQNKMILIDNKELVFLNIKRIF